MVLGLRSRHRKGASVQVDYLVHVGEIKPWPPCQSLRSVRSVLLQWENGDQNSGSLTCGVGDTKIEFNESLTLPLTLSREKRAHDKFQKNCLEFNLYEPRKDKAFKGQLLGTAIINLAEYGIIEENLTISAPLNCKKSFKNTVQPILFVKIQPIDKDSSNSSPKGGLSKEVSLDKDGQDVSELTNEENDDESEIASFTDDDVSSHSSRTIASSTLEAPGASPYQNEKDELEPAMESTGKGNGELTRPLKPELSIPVVNPGIEIFEQPDKSAHILSSIDRKASVTPPVQSFSSSIGYRDTSEESRNHGRSFGQEIVREDSHLEIGKIEEHSQKSDKDELVDTFAEKVESSNKYIQVGVTSNVASHEDSQSNRDDGAQASQWRKNGQVKAIAINDLYVDEEEREREEIERDERILEDMRASVNKQAGKFSHSAIRKQGALRSNTLTSDRRVLGVQGTTISNNKLKHMKSVQLPPHSAKANGFPQNIQNMDKVKKIDHITSNVASENKEAQNGSSNNRIEWESRLEMLEEELREAAAIEVGLYSIVAEHGSSINKVHAPARRLSRFYLHACKAKSKDKRASAARATVSGLVLVSKACGNDVPRLTFWLSNSIMLRAIVSHAVGEIPLSGGPYTNSNVSEEAVDSIEEFDGWQDPKTFIIALEKVEAWIFSRIVESVWWQTLTPHMQSTAASSSRIIGSSSKKTNGRRYALGDQEQGNFSIELWKKAFKDACERLCPIRGGGHECGCLPVARLVMEQLVSRLDVAMFNAILRESDEEMPTDPVSDPIGDSKVLPIPAGRTSFGAGAQLKNAIGNWSRWLTDLFGIEDNDFPEENDSLGDEKRPEFDTSLKPFRLLNALSDLMMLPSEMLADISTRKEVCPIFGAPLIKRVVNNFVPDEFCPHPIPAAVLEALDSEDDAVEGNVGSLTSFPCIANRTVYSPPPAASLASIIGQEGGSQALQRSKSSVLKKAYTSDDELDELDSPLTSILNENFRKDSPRANWTPKGKGGRKVVRYQLLREVWRDGE